MYRCLNELNYAIKDAIKANKQCLCLIININRLHFKDNFKANNFDKASTNPFQNAPATPATAPPNQNPNTPVIINDIATNLIAAISAGAATQQTSPLDGNQIQQTGNIINPALLPLEVQQRLKKGKQHDTYLTKQEGCSFNSTIPNLIVDPAGNTMRKMFHNMDGPH